MKKNRILAVLLAAVMCLGMLVGCGSNATEKADDKGKDKLSVVCTIFPEYDWTKEILGDDVSNYDLTFLLDDGVDLHNYQPTAEDIAKIADCDLFIYVGGESDEWVEDALKESTNSDMKVINLQETIGSSVKEEELVEGMQGEEEENEEEAEEEPEYDEHVWLSLNNAITICEEIKDKLCEIKPESKDKYEKNLEEYNGKLNELNEAYKKTVEDSSKDVLLFADRFPFRYLVDDYGIKYYAAFIGCSAETEASFETITFLANKVDEEKLGCVVVLESSDQSIAKTIIGNTKDKNQKILVLDSMQSISLDKISDDYNYVSIMENNLEVIKEALK